MEDLLGKKLKDRYRVDALVGRGGMAEVYKVWDEARTDALAMKVLREDLAQDKIFLRRFEREAQTLAKLQHRSVVRFYGLERDDLLVFLLLEYIEGTSLREEIFRATAPFSMQRVLEVLRPVCAAMHYAHQMGIVHCDLKPGNILINRHGEILVTDFGIARMVDAATSTMVGIGTPAYMAPELIKGEDPTPQTDVYALGVILYEMLTGGERPFTGERAETAGSTAEKIRWEQMKLAPKPLNDFNPNLPVSVQAVVQCCLAKTPAQRYADIQEVYVELCSVEGDGEATLISPGKKEGKTPSLKGTKEEPQILKKSVEVVDEQQSIKTDLGNVQRTPTPIRERKKLPVFTHLQTRQGLIHDFDLRENRIVISTEEEVQLQDLHQQEPIFNIHVNGFLHDQVRFYLERDSILLQRLDTVAIVNFNIGEIVGELQHCILSTIKDFDFSKNSRYCVCVLSNGRMVCWDMNEGNTLLNSSSFNDNSEKVRIIPNRDEIIKISYFSNIHILSLPELKIKHLISAGTLFGKKNAVCSISGRLIGLWDDSQSLEIYDLEKIESIINIKLNDFAIRVAAFSPDESSLLTIDQPGFFTIRDTQTLQVIDQQASGIQGIDKVMISEDGQYMVTLCKDQRLDYWKWNRS